MLNGCAVLLKGSSVDASDPKFRLQFGERKTLGLQRAIHLSPYVNERPRGQNRTSEPNGI